jgi:hypothetical protein
VFATACSDSGAPTRQPPADERVSLSAARPLDQRAVMIEPADADPDVFQGFSLYNVLELDAFFGRGVGRYEAGVTFRQVNAIYDATPQTPALRYRVRWASSGQWSEPRALQITWAEGEYFNGRALLEADATELEVERDAGLKALHVELPERWLTSPDAPLARELPLVSEREQGGAATLREVDGLRTIGQRMSPATAPAELVIPRSQWGARDPNKICGDVVEPYRATIHHTAIPDVDGPDMNQRMRQMQAYHMDNNGWCDIGYHFVVSQAGLIYQGRSDARRPGAHVGNQNAGNVGVSLIGNYDRDPLVQVQIDAMLRILSWIRASYPGITWDRDHVKGHREWPGQSTACPGRNFMPRFDEFVRASGGGGEPMPMPMERDVSVAVRWLGDAVQARNAGTPNAQDVVVGERLQAEIVVTNRSAEPLRGVALDFSIEEPFLRALNYQIQTDVPAFDGRTWVVNDADSAPENPAKDVMGARGTLTMYAFGAGESKRVLIDLSAEEYSVGRAQHPALLAWVRSIEGVYGPQTEWDQEPALNLVNAARKLQGDARLDVVAPDRWTWGGHVVNDLEGWTSCGPANSAVLSNSDQALSKRVIARGACVESSSWTAIDAERWDQLVISARGSRGTSYRALYWAGEDGAFSEDQVVRFETTSSGQRDRLVVPVGDHPRWRGTITRLRLFWTNAAAPDAGAQVEVALDELFMQSRLNRRTNFTPQEYVTISPVRLLPPGVGAPGDDGGSGGQPGESDQGRTPAVVVNNGGCAVGAPVTPIGFGAPMIFGLLCVIGGRRWRTRRG